MRNKFVIAIALLLASIVTANAMPQTELKNPTENNEFNTNATPFNEQNRDGMHIEYNKFGQEKRNINVKKASYDHYNQNGHQQSILGSQNEVVANRPHQNTLNNNQYNYGNQNKERQIGVANKSERINYNTPMTVEQMSRKSIQTATDDNIIETGDMQNITIGAGGKVDPSTLPSNPYKEVDSPLSDAIPFIIILAGIYAFILRRKQ